MRTQLRKVWNGLCRILTGKNITPHDTVALHNVNNEHERYLRSLVEQSPMYIIRTDVEGKYTYANRAFIEHFVPPDERATLIGTPSLKYIIPQDHQKTLDTVHKCFAALGSVVHVSLHKPGVDGKIHTTEWDFTIILDDHGQPQEFQCVGMDMTDRIELQEVLQVERTFQSMLLENLNAIIWEADAETFQFTYVSAGAERITGYPPKQWLEENFWVNHLYEDDRNASVQFCLNATKALQDHQFEYRFVKADGEIIWLSDTVAVIAEDGKPKVLRGVIIDISDNKQLTQSLHNTETEFRSAVNALGEGIVLQDKDGVVVFCNPRAEEILGLSRDQMMGLTSLNPLWRSIHEDGSPFPGEQHPAMITLRTGKPERDVVMGVHKPDGTLTWILVNTEPLQYTSGATTVEGVVASFTDITEQKAQQQLLRQSQQELQMAVEATGLGIWDWYVQSGKTVFNDRWAEIIGYTLEELQPIDINTRLTYSHPEDLERSNQLLQAHFRGETATYECEARMRHKDGHWVWVLDRGRVIEWNSDGTPHRMTGTHQDITERKNKELELQRLNERYRIITDNSADLITLHTPEGEYSYISPSMKAIFGYEPEELLGQNPYQFFHEEDQRRIREDSHDHVLAGEVRKIRFRMRGKDDRYRVVETVSVPIWGGEDNASVVALQAITRDISDTIALQDELLRSKQFLDETGAIANVGGWELFLDTQRLHWTEETYRIYEVSTETDLSVLQGVSFYHPDDQPIISAAVEQIIAHGTEFDLELRFIAASGKEKWVRAVGKRETRDGKPYRIYGTFQDITEHKTIYDAAVQAHERTQLLLSSSPVPMGLNDSEGNITYLNPAFVQTFGYTQEDIPDVQTWLEAAYPDAAYREQVQESWQRRLAKAQLEKTAFEREEVVVRCKNNTTKTVITHAAPLHGSYVQGEHLVVMYDISERKQSEEVLKKSQDNLKEAQKIAKIGSWEWDIPTNTIIWSEEQYHLFGETPETFQTTYEGYLSHLSAEEQLRTNALVAEVLADKAMYLIEHEITRRDGTTFFAFEQGSVVRDANGTPIRMYGTTQDITERRQQQEELLRSAQFIRTVTNALPSMVGYWTRDLVCTFANNAHTKYFGVQTEKIIGNTLPAVLGEKLFAKNKPFIQAALEGKIQKFERDLQTPEGNTISTLAQYIPDIAEDGSVRGFIALITDVSSIKEAEQALRIGEANLRAIMDSSVQAFWLIDTDLRVIAFNRNVEYSDRVILGKEAQLGVSILEYVVPEQQKEFMESVERALTGETVIHEQDFIIDGDVRWVELMYIPTLNPEGNIIGVTLSNFDITERKTMLLQMAEYSQELESIIDSMLDGLVLLDENQRILLVNPSLQTIFGYAQEELLGQPLSMLIPEHFRTKHAAAMNALILSNDKATAERITTAKGLHADGHEFSIDASIATFKSGSSKKLLAIVRDITEQLQAQEEILTLNRTLESRVQERTRELTLANQEKSELLGIAAHDLKNPLAGIYSSAQLLERYFQKDEHSERFIKMILSASEQMLNIITNLLESNRLESGRLVLDLQTINLAEIISPFVEQYQETAITKGIILHYTPVTDTEPYWIVADELALQQIIDNLISNAVKYTPHWKNIWVAINHRITEAGQRVARVEVKDEGPGLTDADKQKLFGKFARLSAQPTGGENSTGLGLSIVKKLVDLQNGNIWCESQHGHGATFIVELPSAQPLPMTE